MTHLIQVRAIKDGFHAMWSTRPNIRGCPLGRGHTPEAAVEDLIWRTNTESKTKFDSNNTLSSLSPIAWLDNFGPNVRLNKFWYSVNGDRNNGITDIRFRSECKATNDYDRLGY